MLGAQDRPRYPSDFPAGAQGGEREGWWMGGMAPGPNWWHWAPAAVPTEVTVAEKLCAPGEKGNSAQKAGEF